MLKLDEKIETLARDLPDADEARLFYERITSEHLRVKRQFERDAGLLSDALALAAWSPLLSTTLAQNPDYLNWLAREKTQTRVREAEELGESLARFALTHTQLGAGVLLARFRRRELLRVYLHDIRKTATLVETTEELSNLADAVLQYALSHAGQELDNLYGAPQCTDARGRTSRASFCIVALGKLGSRELNYASDIDLMFIYSDDGETSGGGERGVTSNREYFCKLAERVAGIAGKPTGEGAAYRVDLRLRPHGRDGALACSLREALRYYRETAHAWELQALIRSRASAGSAALYARFAEAVRPRVYRSDETVARALAHVRLAKQKIDRQHGDTSRGFNVKLGRGGIREIEFIAQALQLAYGGRDAWLQHAPHTLISLGRLADRHLINERERSELFDAYTFLRTLEHRVQMEQGLQTHLVPDQMERRALVARRMHFDGARSLADFERALEMHTTHVHNAYRRVFGDTEQDGATATQHDNDARQTKEETPHKKPTHDNSTLDSAISHESTQGTSTLDSSTPNDSTPGKYHAFAAKSAEFAAFSLQAHEAARHALEPHVDAGQAAALVAAQVFASRLSSVEKENLHATNARTLARHLHLLAGETLNHQRALSLLARIASSLDKSGAEVNLTDANLRALVRLCGASEFFGEMIASNPALIASLTTSKDVIAARDHRSILRAGIDAEGNFRAELSALRRAWAHLLVEIGACDACGEITLAESNRLQTALAASSINAALLVARRELVRRHGRLLAGPRLAVFALGRMGSGGTDYGSDLDLVLVYDPRVPSPLAGLVHREAYARLAELMTTALSALTRDGTLYRVDLRLRPDGKNGATVIPSDAFINYLRERADVWEWLAYVKLHAVAGDLELGRAVEREARAAIHEAARRTHVDVLRDETRRVRERLERERAGNSRASMRETDIKFGAGGMLDVYFATRYLQLRDNLPDSDTGDRSTRATLARLRDSGSLNDEDHAALNEGYALLRLLDHHLRLIVGRSTRLPAVADHPLLADLAHRLTYPSVNALTDDLSARMRAVRAAYERITTAG